MDHVLSADKAWVKDLEHVFTYGNTVSPRGMLVYESLAYRSVIPMRSPIIQNPIRKLGYKFMAAEAAWILSGDNRVSTIAPYSKDISKFSDDGHTFFGAYGPKVRDQIDYVVATLHNDLSTRQAVINIWRENPGPTKDVPCTLSLQFLVRNGLLHCVASMRSSDLWLGHPYDIVNFSVISLAVLISLRNMQGDEIQLGNLFLTAGSKHIYGRNIDDVKAIIDQYSLGGVMSTSIPDSMDIFDRLHYDDVDELIENLWDVANSPSGMLAFLK